MQYIPIRHIIVYMRSKHACFLPSPSRRPERRWCGATPPRRTRPRRTKGANQATRNTQVAKGGQRQNTLFSFRRPVEDATRTQYGSFERGTKSNAQREPSRHHWRSACNTNDKPNSNATPLPKKRGSWHTARASAAVSSVQFSSVRAH